MKNEMETIFDLIMKINEETEFAAFLQISGHVNVLRVYISRDKEKHFNERVYNAEFYYSGELIDEDVEVKGVINNLKAILEVQ